MPFFCISFRSWNAINLKRLRKETWKIHRTRGRCWKHSRAVWELQAGDWQLPLPTWEELFQSHWSCHAWGTEPCPVLPRCCICGCLDTAPSVAQGTPDTPAQVPRGRTGSTGTGLAGMGQAGTGSARILEREMVTVLLHGNTRAKSQILQGNLYPHPRVFPYLINHVSK